MAIMFYSSQFIFPLCLISKQKPYILWTFFKKMIKLQYTYFASKGRKPKEENF